MKQQTSSYPILVLGSIVPICLCGLFVGLPILLNDLRLSVFAKNLYTYPLPPNTTILDRYFELSKVGNGTNCHYKAEQSMVSTLPRSEIEQYYEDVELPRVSLSVIYDGAIGIPVDLDFNESISNVDTSYFTLTILDFSFGDDTFDIRCQ